MIDLLLMFLLSQNHTTETIPFPVTTGGVTFCFDLYKKVDGVKQKYVECNYVEMNKRKLEQLRDHLQNWTMQK